MEKPVEKPVSDSMINDSFYSETSMNSMINDGTLRVKKVDRLANRLVEIFNNPGGRDFYCKVGWKLSEAHIWRHVETAKKRGRIPARYFTTLCKNDGV